MKPWWFEVTITIIQFRIRFTKLTKLHLVHYVPQIRCDEIQREYAKHIHKTDTHHMHTDRLTQTQFSFPFYLFFSVPFISFSLFSPAPPPLSHLSLFLCTSFALTSPSPFPFPVRALSTFHFPVRLSPHLSEGREEPRSSLIGHP